MTSDYHSLATFLPFAKGRLANAIKNQDKVTIVTGNQSADLDSFTSSILFAYLRSQAPPVDAFTPFYIPLLNIPAEDIELRPEFKALCRHTGIQTADFVTLDDLPKTNLLKDELRHDNTRWILVDHNKLEGELGEIYGNRVHGVIDHHEEEDAVPKETHPEPRVVEKCGSCTSLIVHHLTSGDGHSGKPALDPLTAKFAIASIIVDTKNLKDQNKVCALDIRSAEYLESKIRAEDGDWKRKTFHKELTKAKKDIEGLPLQGILRKDYKQWTEAGMKLGMSTVVKPLSFLTEKANEGKDNSKDAWNREAAQFMEERGLNIWAIMTTWSTRTSKGKEFRRELCIQRTEGKAEDQAVKRFKKGAAEELKLEVKEVETLGGMERRKVWWQRDVSKSRKQVGPLLRKAMRDDEMGERA